MKYADANKLGLAVFLLGGLLTTTSHYWEVWYAGYGISILAGLIFAGVYHE